MSESLSPAEISSAKWLVFSTEFGHPFTTVIPATYIPLLNQVRQPKTLAASVRWQLGRTLLNSNFQTGSGFEGHLAAYESPQISEQLTTLQENAFSIARNVFGRFSFHTKIENFLADCSRELDWNTILGFREIMDIVLARARAIRSMSLKGYGYNGNDKIVFPFSRIQRVSQILQAVYLAANPSLISTALQLNGNNLIYEQSFFPPNSNYGFTKELLGGDLGNTNLKFLAELGRFGSFIVPLIRQIKYS